MFNKVFEKLLIYAAGSGASSGQRMETAAKDVSLETTIAELAPYLRG